MICYVHVKICETWRGGGGGEGGPLMVSMLFTVGAISHLLFATIEYGCY